MTEINQTIKWTKVDINDSSTWPSKDFDVLVIIKPYIGSYYNEIEKVRTGYLHVYKTVPPKFRVHNSLQSTEYPIDRIDYWTIINTKLNGK